ncbi:MAG: shikimate kinase [Pseudomonadota bacterium]
MRFSLIGNSGSGKSTYAGDLAARYDLPILDLDQIAWEPNAPTTLRSAAAASLDVSVFCEANENWIVEGCYADLIDATLTYQPELIFLDPGEAQCVANCRNRPWEPSKYSSKVAQDENLNFLLSWVRGYYHRDGNLSHTGHLALFNGYPGSKQRLLKLPPKA